MLLLAVAIKPRAGLNSRGRSVRKPSHSCMPVPGTGNRPTHERCAGPRAFRFGVSADACQEMLPSMSPQIRFSVGAFNTSPDPGSRGSSSRASRSPPRYGAVPGSRSAERKHTPDAVRNLRRTPGHAG